MEKKGFALKVLCTGIAQLPTDVVASANLPNSSAILGVKGKFEDLASFEEKVLQILDDDASMNPEKLPKFNAQIAELVAKRAAASPVAPPTTAPRPIYSAPPPAGYQTMYSRPPPTSYPPYSQPGIRPYPSGYPGMPSYRPPY